MTRLDPGERDIYASSLQELENFWDIHGISVPLLTMVLFGTSVYGMERIPTARAWSEPQSIPVFKNEEKHERQWALQAVQL